MGPHKDSQTTLPTHLTIGDTMDPTAFFQERQDKLLTAIQAAGLDAVILNPGPSLAYFTGLSFHLSERPVLVSLAPGYHPTIVLPALETAKVEHLSYPLQSLPYGEDPTTWSKVVKQAFQFLSANSPRIGVEPRGLRFLEITLLEEALTNICLTNAEPVIASLRRIKDQAEIESMQKAADIAQNALRATLPMIRAGATEIEIASELFMQLVHHGSSPVNPFNPIVSGGPNSANPHAAPSHRPLSPGDLLVIDYGAYIDGYFSDITRTFAIETVEPRLQHIAYIVHQANQAARDAIKPGVNAASVDQAARSIIESQGYGQYFIHRTGHGLGLEVHEEPYIRPGNLLTLEPGMTFTIEPGIYLPRHNGVRIEDNLLVTPTGSHCFTNLPRELVTLPLS